jgi:hypothetical protein
VIFFIKSAGPRSPADFCWSGGLYDVNRFIKSVGPVPWDIPPCKQDFSSKGNKTTKNQKSLSSTLGSFSLQKPVHSVSHHHPAAAAAAEEDRLRRPSSYDDVINRSPFLPEMRHNSERRRGGGGENRNERYSQIIEIILQTYRVHIKSYNTCRQGRI